MVSARRSFLFRSAYYVLICILSIVLSGCAKKKASALTSLNNKDAQKPIELVMARPSAVAMGPQRSYTAWVTIHIQPHENNRKITCAISSSNPSFLVYSSDIPIGNGLEDNRNDAFYAPTKYTRYFDLVRGRYVLEATLHRSDGSHFKAQKEIIIY